MMCLLPLIVRTPTRSDLGSLIRPVYNFQMNIYVCIMVVDIEKEFRANVELGRLARRRGERPVV